MRDKKNLIAIVLVIITVLVVIISYFFNNEDKEKNIEIKIVTNYSDFYTVNSCIHRTVGYLSQKDSDSVYYVLNEKYKKENNINKNEVLNIFDSVDENSTFVSKKMYYEEISENLVKYYIEGYIEQNIIYDEYDFVDNSNLNNYFIVYLDRDNKTFSVEPYNGEFFKSGDLNE